MTSNYRALKKLLSHRKVRTKAFFLILLLNFRRKKFEIVFRAFDVSLALLKHWYRITSKRNRGERERGERERERKERKDKEKKREKGLQCRLNVACIYL